MYYMVVSTYDEAKLKTVDLNPVLQFCVSVIYSKFWSFLPTFTNIVLISLIVWMMINHCTLDYHVTNSNTFSRSL